MVLHRRTKTVLYCYQAPKLTPACLYATSTPGPHPLFRFKPPLCWYRITALKDRQSLWLGLSRPLEIGCSEPVAGGVSSGLQGQVPAEIKGISTQSPYTLYPERAATSLIRLQSSAAKSNAIARLARANCTAVQW